MLRFTKWRTNSSHRAFRVNLLLSKEMCTVFVGGDGLARPVVWAVRAKRRSYGEIWRNTTPSAATGRSMSATGASSVFATTSPAYWHRARPAARTDRPGRRLVRQEAADLCQIFCILHAARARPSRQMDRRRDSAGRNRRPRSACRAIRTGCRSRRDNPRPARTWGSQRFPLILPFSAEKIPLFGR